MAKLVELRALSIAQPWAECIVSKGKNVENRSWNTKFRGYFAIHASQSKSAARFEFCASEMGLRFDLNDLAFGCIVGFAELVDVITEGEVTRNTQKWYGGEYGFILKNVIKLKNPIAVKGSLSFWKVKGRTLNAALKELSAEQIKKIERKPLSK